MWFIGVEVEQETTAPPPEKNPGSAPGIYFAYLPMRSLVHILIYLVVLGCQLVLVLISIHVQLLCKL